MQVFKQKISYVLTIEFVGWANRPYNMGMSFNGSKKRTLIIITHDSPDRVVV